jgi:hypothetical protein
VEEDSTKRTGDHALLAGNALFTVNIIDTILRCDGSGWTVLHAFGYFTLSADNGHPYDRVRVNHHHPNRTLLGVVHSETVNGTDQFANLASGTSLSHNSQLQRHVFLLLKTTKIDNPPPSPLLAGAQTLEKGELFLLPFFKGGWQGL